MALAVVVRPDDLARVVDAACKGAEGGRGSVEGGVGATALKEPVDAAAVVVIPDDLVRTAHAECLGGAVSGKARGIVESVEDLDGHDTGSSMTLLQTSVDHEAEPGGSLPCSA